MSRVRLPIIVAGLYALLFAVALWFPLSGLADDPLSGVYAVLLGAPWSFVSVFVVDSIDPALMDHGWGFVGAAVGGVFNTFIIYWVVKKVVGVSAEKEA